MALFGEPLHTEVISLVTRRHQQLTELLDVAQPRETSVSTSGVTPIERMLTLLIQIANGEIIRGEASRRTVEQVETALATLHDLLFGTVYGTTASIPSDFWESDIGVLSSRARWWLSGDELITISNAAALAFGENTQANRMRIVRAIDSGILDWIPDPSVANPQQNRRVLRPQVERLGEQRRRP